MTAERARITIFDTTLRDGEQSPGCSMNHPEKLRLAQQLERLGVDVIEAGFPIASDGDFEAVKAIATVIRRPIIAGLARACQADIERAWEALKYAARPRIHVFLATSDIHLQYKLRITRDQCLAQAREAIRLAKSLCEDVEFSPEDATRTDHDFLCQVLEAVVEAGATTLNIPDTVGFTVPTEFGDLITMIRQRVKGIENVVISAHCHNDLGMAVANALAAVAAGARQVECTINGIGERAGNASLEEIVMAMRVRPDRYPYETGVVGEQIFASSQLLSEITGVPVQPNKAVTGRNAFAHEAGIHQDGMLKNPLTYEIMTPKSVGVPDSKLVLGKHSGRHALGIRCEQLGYQFDRRALDDIYRRFVRLADKIKKVDDHHLLELIRDTHKPSGSATPLIEPLVQAKAAAVNSSDAALSSAGQAASNPAPAVEPKPFPIGPQTNAFGVPLPADPHHEQTQQEDYLWGV
jgi:2-isopropylmalate synthase